MLLVIALFSIFILMFPPLKAASLFLKVLMFFVCVFMMYAVDAKISFLSSFQMRNYVAGIIASNILLTYIIYIFVKKYT